MAAFAVVGWALSGLTHPLMSLLGPRAASFMPPETPQHPLPDQWREGVQAAGVTQLAALRWVELDGELWLQLAERVEQPLRYARHSSGPFEAKDADYAVRLARHYAGDDVTRVIGTRHISAFSSAYPEVNRVLPVWRVRFDDGREVDVSTREDRLIGYTDARRRFLSSTFRNVHTLAPLKPWPWVRVGAIGLMLIGVWGVAFAGLRMALQRGARHGMRRAHRWAGVALVLPMLVWTGTGAFHLVHYALKPEVGIPVWPSAALGPVADEALAERRVMAWQGQLWSFSEEGRYRHAETLLSAAEWAMTVAGIEGEAMLVTRFGDGYGFINRRLPVWRVTDRHGVNHFIEPNLASVVATVNAVDRLELWTFNQLHKWQLFDRLGRAGRDALMSFFALSLLLLALVGLWLWRGRHSRGANP